jgi:hypothetical protein
MEQKNQAAAAPVQGAAGGQKRSLEEEEAPTQANKNHKNQHVQANTGLDSRYAAHFMTLAARGVSIPKQKTAQQHSDNYLYGYFASTIKSNDRDVTRYYATIASESYRITGPAPANAGLLTGRIFRVKATTLAKANANAGDMTTSINWSDATLVEGADLTNTPSADIQFFPRAYGTITFPRDREGAHVQVQEFPAANTGNWRNTRGCVLPMGSLRGPQNNTAEATLLKGEPVCFQIGVTATGNPIAFNLRRVTLLDHLNKVEGVDDPVETIKEKSFRLQKDVDKHYTNKVYRATASSTLREHQAKVAIKPFILVQCSPSPLDQCGTHTITVGDLNETARERGLKNWSSLNMDDIVESYHRKLQVHDQKQNEQGAPSHMASSFETNFVGSKSLSIIFDVDASKDQFSSMAFTATRASFAKVGSAGHKYVNDVIITKRIERPLPGMVAATNGGSCFAQSSCPALHSIHLDPAGYNLQVVQYDAIADTGLTSPVQVGSLHAHIALIKYSAEAIGAPVTEHPLGAQSDGEPLGKKMMLAATKITVLYRAEKSAQSATSTRITQVIEDMMRKGLMRQTYNFLDEKYLVFQTLKRITLVPTPAARLEVIRRLLKAGASVSAERDIGRPGVTVRTRNGIPLPKEALTRRGVQTTMLDKFSFRFTAEDPDVSTESVLEGLGIEVSNEGQSITYAGKGNSPWGEVITENVNTQLGVPSNVSTEKAADTVYIQGFEDTYGPEGVKHFIDEVLLQDSNASCTIVDSPDEKSEPTDNGVYVRFLHRLSGAPGAHNEQYTMAITRKSAAAAEDTILQLLKSSVGAVADKTKGKYRQQHKGLHWLKAHSSVPSLAMCQPQQFDQEDVDSHEQEEDKEGWIDNSQGSRGARSTRTKTNKTGGYQSLLTEEEKKASSPAPRRPDGTDFPVEDTLIGNWLKQKLSKWNHGNNSPNAKQLKKLHKNIVKIFTWYQPDYHKAGQDKLTMKFSAQGDTLGYQLDKAFSAGVQLNTILSKVENATLKCNGSSGPKVASQLAQELKLAADTQLATNRSKKVKKARKAHNLQSTALSEEDTSDDDLDDFAHMTAANADTAQVHDLPGSEENDKPNTGLTNWLSKAPQRTVTAPQPVTPNVAAAASPEAGKEDEQKEEKEEAQPTATTVPPPSKPAVDKNGSKEGQGKGKKSDSRSKHPKTKKGKTTSAGRPPDDPNSVANPGK